jgi:hypothetical protein
VLVVKRFPDLMLAIGKDKNNIKNIEKALVTKWDAMVNLYFTALVESMPIRI